MWNISTETSLNPRCLLESSIPVLRQNAFSKFSRSCTFQSNLTFPVFCMKGSIVGRNILNFRNNRSWSTCRHSFALSRHVGRDRNLEKKKKRCRPKETKRSAKPGSKVHWDLKIRDMVGCQERTKIARSIWYQELWGKITPDNLW